MKLANNHRNDLVSILIPVYNAEHYIQECLNSILKQTYPYFEVIIINDGSQDRSGEICDEYAKKDSRIKVLHQENKGVAIARNIAINYAQGLFILFVDSDDWIEPSLLETSIKKMLYYDADIVGFSYALEYEGKTIYKSIPTPIIEYNKKEALIALWNDHFLSNHLCLKLYKREFVQAVFPEGKVYEDFLILPIWFSQIKKCVLISDILYHYRKHKGSITGCSSLQNQVDFIRARAQRYCYYTDVLKLTASQDNTLQKLILRLVTSNILRLYAMASSPTEVIPFFKAYEDLYEQLKKRSEYKETKKQRLAVLLFFRNSSSAIFFIAKLLRTVKII